MPLSSTWCDGEDGCGNDVPQPIILFLRKEKTKNEDSWERSDQPEDLNDLDLRICLDKWVHFKDPVSPRGEHAFLTLKRLDVITL